MSANLLVDGDSKSFDRTVPDGNGGWNQFGNAFRVGEFAASGDSVLKLFGPFIGLRMRPGLFKTCLLRRASSSKGSCFAYSPSGDSILGTHELYENYFAVCRTRQGHRARLGELSARAKMKRTRRFLMVAIRTWFRDQWIQYTVNASLRRVRIRAVKAYCSSGSALASVVLDPGAVWFDDASLVWMISDARAVAGDYNNNGFVDAADYVRLRDDVRAIRRRVWPAPDGNRQRLIDNGDYTIWKKTLRKHGRLGQQRPSRRPSRNVQRWLLVPLAALVPWTDSGAAGVRLRRSRRRRPAAQKGTVMRHRVSHVGTPGFISVGAVGQRLLNIILSLMVLALSFLREMTVVALNCVGGIGSSVLRRWGAATRRWNSSLRSHRTWRSQCRRVFSGLNKTMFAAVGPNSRCRGHQGANPAGPGSSLEENEPLGPNEGRSRSPIRWGVVARARRRKDSADVNDSVVSGVKRLASFFRGVLWLAAAVRSLAGPRSKVFPSRIMAYKIRSRRRPMATLALGLPIRLDQSLANRFLPGVALAERDGRLAQGPAQA